MSPIAFIFYYYFKFSILALLKMLPIFLQYAHLHPPPPPLSFTTLVARPIWCTQVFCVIILPCYVNSSKKYTSNVIQFYD